MGPLMPSSMSTMVVVAVDIALSVDTCSSYRHLPAPVDDRSHRLFKGTTLAALTHCPFASISLLDNSAVATDTAVSLLLLDLDLFFTSITLTFSLLNLIATNWNIALERHRPALQTLPIQEELKRWTTDLRSQSTHWCSSVHLQHDARPFWRFRLDM